MRTRGKRRTSIAGLLLASCWLPAAAQSHAGDAFQVLLKQGFELHQAARFAEAIPVLDRARKLAPDDYFVNLLLGIDLLRSGHAAGAVPRLEMAARVRPAEEFPVEYLGEADAELGRYPAAVEAYQGAMLRSHNSEQAVEAWAGFALERFRQISAELRATKEGIAVALRLQQGAAHPDRAAGRPATLAALERRLAIRQPRVDTWKAASRRPTCSITPTMEASTITRMIPPSAESMEKREAASCSLGFASSSNRAIQYRRAGADTESPAPVVEAMRYSRWHAHSARWKRV